MFNLREEQEKFLNAIWEFRPDELPGDAPKGVSGRFSAYTYSVFERIRASIEEDYPRLFEWIEERNESPENWVRDLLRTKPPNSWTLAEAAVGMKFYLESKGEFEALRLALLDEAENESAWCEEWNETRGAPTEKMNSFLSGSACIVRTRTLRKVGEVSYFRGSEGVQEFLIPNAFRDLFQVPTRVDELEAVFAKVNEAPEVVQKWIQESITNGYLVLTPVDRND